MDLYNSFMDIDDVIEYLNTKTNRKFNIDRIIKFIEDKNIPIVFEYKGWGTWSFANKGKYQSLNIQLGGYFNIQNDSETIKIFKGCSNYKLVKEARIYRLDSYRIPPIALDHIRDIGLDYIPDDPLNGLEPKKGDTISFKTGGRSPITRDPNAPKSINVYSSKADIPEMDSSKNNGKVGVLKVDLEEYLNNTQTETMDNEIKMEALESKIEKLEFENEKLKSENASLTQQLEELAISNSLIKKQEQNINRLNEQLNNQANGPTNINEKEGQGDSLLILGAVMHCIQDAAKKNYTQELLTQVILEKYKSVSGISESTLKKKFPESKKYINQKITTQ